MKERMVEVAGELEAVVRRTGEEFPLVKVYNQQFPWEDYGNPQIPLSRVKADRDEMERILSLYFKECREKGQAEDFTFVFAVYCNLYIKKGMYIPLGTDGFEEGAGEWYEGPKDQTEYFKCLWRGISRQDYSYFTRALELRPQSAMAAMYLFVRAASKFCMVISQEQDADGIETDVWKYFDLLPEEYQEYALGAGNFRRETDNLANDPNLLPYIEFKSMKEYLVTYILQYYKSILKTMGLEADQVDGKKIYHEILSRFQFLQMQAIFGEAGAGAVENEQQALGRFIELVEKMLPAIMEGTAFQKSVEFQFTFLFDKLHELLTESYHGVKESFSAQLAFPDQRASILSRNTFLHIPVILPVKTSREFFLSRRLIFRQKQELERQRRRNQEMMDFYIHSWKHISYPQTVKSVAEELRKKDMPLSNMLFKAYNSERTLKGNLQRIQYSFSDRQDQVSRAFSQGFYCVGAASGRRVPELLQESLDLVLFKMLMEDTDSSRRMNLCRDSLRTRISLEQLRQSYVAAFVDNTGIPEDIFEWFDRNIFKMEVTADQDWQEIPVMENTFAESQLMEIFVELFTNVLTHGADWCRAALESNEQDLSICVSNGLGGSLHGSRKGLQSLENIVNKLNMDEIQNAVTGEVTDSGAFAVKIILRRGLMYKRGRRG